MSGYKHCNVLHSIKWRQTIAVSTNIGLISELKSDNKAQNEQTQGKHKQHGSECKPFFRRTTCLYSTSP